jgi:hypothetical protein
LTPVGAAWLNLIEGWWRIFRRKAFAGASLADVDDIAYATQIATAQLNATPARGSGDAHRRHIVTCAAASSIAFEERSDNAR